jgi:membrane-associated phospholipid phosphatase
MDKASPATQEVTRPPASPRPDAARLRAWLVTGGLLLVLGVLTGNVLAHGPLVGLDEHIRDAVQARATSPAWRWLNAGRYSPARLPTALGRYYVAVPVLALTAVVLAVRRHTIRPVAAAAIGVAMLLATVIPAKVLIGRVGPGLATLGGHGLGVFPSGHTTTACVCFSLAVLLIVAGRRGWARWLAVILLALLWLAVGAALVWRDYHWFTDVAAGWALSALIIELAMWAIRDRRPRSVHPPG